MKTILSLLHNNFELRILIDENKKELLYVLSIEGEVNAIGKGNIFESGFAGTNIAVERFHRLTAYQYENALRNLRYAHKR